MNKEGVIVFFEGDNANVRYVYIGDMVNFVDIGAWQYLQQYRHAYFDKMQVFLLLYLLNHYSHGISKIYGS